MTEPPLAKVIYLPVQDNEYLRPTKQQTIVCQCGNEWFMALVRFNNDGTVDEVRRQIVCFECQESTSV